MKYKVLHSHLIHSTTPTKDKDGNVKPSADRRFKAGDHITEADLEGTDWTVDFLQRNGAIEPLEGTEAPGEKPTPQQVQAKAAAAVPGAAGAPGAQNPPAGVAPAKK
jgi:hypothetical protein